MRIGSGTAAAAAFALAASLAVPLAAADLPAEPAAVDYVGICKADGGSHIAVPGTDTCLSYRGYVQAEYMVFASNRASRQLGWYAANVRGALLRGRMTGFVDSTTPTAYGPLETHVKVEWTDNDALPVYVNMKQAYVTFMGLTAGRNQSFYDFYTGNTFEDYFEPAWSDFQTSLLAYTAALGGGWTATVSLEDATTRNLGIKLGGPNIGYGPGFGGPPVPDVVGALALAEGWGSAQLMGAAHTLRAVGGRGGTATGWAVGGGVTINLPMLAAGDSLSVQGNVAHGALAYAANNPVGPGRGFAGADAVLLDHGRTLALGTAWSVSGGLTHNWTDTLSSTFEASYLSAEQRLGRFSFENVDFQANLIYMPVTNLQMGIESEYKSIRRTAGSEGVALMTMFVIERDF